MSTLAVFVVAATVSIVGNNNVVVQGNSVIIEREHPPTKQAEQPVIPPTKMGERSAAQPLKTAKPQTRKRSPSPVSRVKQNTGDCFIVGDNNVCK